MKKQSRKYSNKMKTFDSIKNCFTNLGFNSPHSNRKDLLKIKNILSILLMGIEMVFTSVYIYYEASNFEEYVDGIFLLSSLILTFFTFTTLLWQMPMHYTFINHLESTIAKRLSNPASSAIYMEIDEKLQKWDKIFDIVLVKVIPISLIITKLIACFIMYTTTDLGGDAFELPNPSWFPFDWKNPIGYLIACSIEYIFLTNILFATFYGLIYVMRSIFMLICMTVDIKRDLNLINKKVTVLKKNRPKFVKRFTDTIQFHYDTKQLTETFSKPWESILAVTFLWCTIAICCALLLIQMQLNSNYPMAAVYYRFYQICISLATVFGFCEFGQRVSNAFAESSDAFNQLKWYLFPVEMWHTLPTVFISTQQPIDFYVFGNVCCSREDFKKVANKAYSYFMMLKHMVSR